MISMMFTSEPEHQRRSRTAELVTGKKSTPAKEKSSDPPRYHYYSASQFVAPETFRLHPRESRMIFLDKNLPVYQIGEHGPLVHKHKENVCYVIFNRSKTTPFEVIKYTKLSAIMADAQIKAFLTVLDLSTSHKTVRWSMIDEHGETEEEDEEEEDEEEEDCCRPRDNHGHWQNDDDNDDESQKSCSRYASAKPKPKLYNSCSSEIKKFADIAKQLLLNRGPMWA